MKNIDLRPKVTKTITSAAVSATFLAFSAWTLAHSFTIEMISITQASMPKLVDLSIESIDTRTGNFTAEGVSADNPNQVWEITGTVVGKKLEIEFENVNSSRRIVATGKIDDDGVLSGRAASDDGELFEWEATGALIEKSNT